jgi:UDP-N-acetylglucosamine 2-epimerase (non-hydrolysing)
MNIASIVGTRPNFIKCAAISKEIRKDHEETLIHTGQHYDYEMSKIFFEELDIPEPDVHLDVGSGSHGWQTGEMLKRIEKVLLGRSFDMVLVYGDCNCTLAGALAAAKMHIPVAHVEAGVRSYDKGMPEEINRVLVDHCSDLLLCPTQHSVHNLTCEGITQGVHLVGDVMVDVLCQYVDDSEDEEIVPGLHLHEKGYLVLTLHRPGTTDNKDTLEVIVGALCHLDETVVFPMHPRTKHRLQEFGLYERLASHVTVVEPMGYLSFMRLLKNAKRVLTDSGGIQKEAFVLGVPCVTLRENTEWVETVESGWNILVGCDYEKIIRYGSSFAPSSKRTIEYTSGCQEILKVLQLFEEERRTKKDTVISLCS